MNHININNVADIFFQLGWTSELARHTDAYAARGVNFWRDLFPHRLRTSLENKQAGDQLSIDFSPEELFRNGQSRSVQTFKRAQFDPVLIGKPDLRPLFGRFYPKGLLRDVAGVFSANRQPFRCVDVNDRSLQGDLGHPLSERPVSLNVSVGSVSPKFEERGGGMRDWIETICDGVGMQAPWMGRPTDFFEGNPFARQDESADQEFYAKPRLVQHLDDAALGVIQDLYGRFIKDGMNVLDLMGSWDSHFPSSVRLSHLAGLGLNAYELEKNERLTDRRVQDLNQDLGLDFPENHFDAVVCTASVEYLIDPISVFSEVARVLRPGGPFVVTFSNRWFEPKAVAIWKELHEFERMGLVLEYFRRSGKFQKLQTYSLRGLGRPVQDKYYMQLPYADPVYAVWGEKI